MPPKPTSASRTVRRHTVAQSEQYAAHPTRVVRLRAATILIALLVAGCDLPKDPDGTTERVLSTHILRVGASENPPWVRFNGDEVAGIEPDLMRAFAGQLGAQVEWVRNGETHLLHALEKRELDVVVGGITAGSPWASRLGTTQTYLKAKKIVALPVGSTEPANVNGLAVQVAPGEPNADRLRREGARPVSLIGPTAPTARAIYEWEAQARGLTRTRFDLGEEKHVLLASPGENQLLLRLDRFLAEARPVLGEILDREGRR